jgi:hypothetical protein
VRGNTAVNQEECMFARIARFPRIATGFGLMVILAAGVLARTAKAWNPQPDPPFGMVGIVEGQTVRLNLVNAASPLDTQIPPPCRARLRFLDAGGTVVADQNVEVPAGQATFVDFSPSTVPVNTIGDFGPIRSEVRAAVTFLDDQTPPPCRVNVEVFENATGRTTVLYPPDPCHGLTCRIDE